MSGRWRVAAVIVMAGTLAAACGQAAVSPPSTPQPSPTPDPVAACVVKLTHWADAQIQGGPDSGLDYQEMGLSGAENQALNEIVKRAGAAGTSAVGPLVRDACTQLAAHPDAAPWA
ncbi:MAG: hypothetical protein QOI16_2126 [Pseudonocardiales bacterium]|nr:hypothetical protein [Pseudonocardiales bacterium]